MFVDFVNMFSDPTGFFKSAPLWVSFVLPGVITSIVFTLLWWYRGRPDFLSLRARVKLTGKPEDDTRAFAFFDLLAYIFWGIIVTPSFEAHGVHTGFPLVICCVLGWLALDVQIHMIPWGISFFKKRYH